MAIMGMEDKEQVEKRRHLDGRHEFRKKFVEMKIIKEEIKATKLQEGTMYS